MDEPRRSRTTVLPSPRGTLTPPSDGALICSSSWRLARFDLRCLPRPAPPLPKAPWVPPRPRPPLPKPPPAGAPPPAPGAPVPGAPPGRPGPRAPPPGRPAPAGAGRSVRLGIMPGVGRFPPAPAGRPAPAAPAGRGAPGRAPGAPPVRGAPGRGPPAPAAGRGPPGRSPSVRLPPGRGMPWEGANGLLPGREGRSLSPPRPRGMPWDVANGLLPGRGPPGRGAEPPWRAGAAGVSALGAGRAPGLMPVDGAAGAWAAGLPERAAGAAGAAAGAGAAAAGAGASVLVSAALGCSRSRRGRRTVCRGAGGCLGGGRGRFGLRSCCCVGERVAEFPHNGGLNGGRGRANEFAQFLQFGYCIFGSNTELFSKLMYADLGHISPVSVRTEPGTNRLLLTADLRRECS